MSLNAFWGIFTRSGHRSGPDEVTGFTTRNTHEHLIISTMTGLFRTIIYTLIYPKHASLFANVTIMVDILDEVCLHL